MKTSLFATTLILSVGAFIPNAMALPISNSATGLASPAVTITFSEVVFPSGTSITNEFSSFGVTFSPNAFYDPQPGFLPDESIGNFDFSITLPTLSLFFSSLQTDAAFQLITNPGTSTFTARLGGVDVETFNASTDTDLSAAYYGFTGIAFDEIAITPGGSNGAMLLDNLQLSADVSANAVPEPSTYAMLCGSLLAFGTLKLRRR